jgi:hypothetical protein
MQVGTEVSRQVGRYASRQQKLLTETYSVTLLRMIIKHNNHLANNSQTVTHASVTKMNLFRKHMNSKSIALLDKCGLLRPFAPSILEVSN